MHIRIGDRNPIKKMNSYYFFGFFGLLAAIYVIDIKNDDRRYKIAAVSGFVIWFVINIIIYATVGRD